MMELSLEELDNLRCRNCTSSPGNGHGGTRYKPYAFTEQGVAMLSSVLRSEQAIEINIRIMRAFIAMRRSVSIRVCAETKAPSVPRLLSQRGWIAELRMAADSFAFWFDENNPIFGTGMTESKRGSGPCGPG